MDLTTQSQIIHPASVSGDIALTATIPQEMVEAQRQLISWCEKKIDVCKFEANELFEATEHAKKAKWKYTTLLNLYNKAFKKTIFYEKMKEALLQGYYIVPNFPISLFAIRTKKRAPKAGHVIGRWRENHEQKSQELIVGKGEYQNPFPVIHQRTVKVGIDEKTQTWADHWDEMDFPITMAKPEIMEATSRAMALNIFDQIGIMPAKVKEDPVIIGQIKQKTGPYTTKIVSFLIAWHLNTNVL